jgi:hypothetical protein
VCGQGFGAGQCRNVIGDGFESLAVVPNDLLRP